MTQATQRLIGIGTGSLLVGLGFAAIADAMTLVNTELVLSIDTSGSVDASEYDLQIQGYIDAFNSTAIRSQISSLSEGVAVAVNTWGSSVKQSAVGSFFHLTDAASIDNFINNALNPLKGGVGSGGTNIAAGMNDATNALLSNDFVGNRLVIDVSGDGEQNTSCFGFGNCVATVEAARDNAVANGITINGLPILTSLFPNLDTYYTNHVIGGDNSFLVAANDFPDFASAVEQKIGREIAPPDDPTSTPEPASLLGLGIVGLAGVGAALKRKQNA